MATSEQLKAPFPYFGGKSVVAPLVWERLGDVPNYCEPFFGSGAVLLARPHAPRTETINDACGYVANFWRSVQSAPEAVAEWADWPVSECDLHARHQWLVDTAEDRLRKLRAIPTYSCHKAAGWWAWGACQWIGSGWCRDQRPSLQMPSYWQSGVTAWSLGGDTASRRSAIRTMMHRLQDRLAVVRILCGDWSRCVAPSVTSNHGLTGVFLDPPYSHSERHEEVYSTETDCSAAVREWCLANGDNPLLRIALCGYEGEHQMPDSWECVPWKARGGYGSQGDGRGRENAARERIWFSPHCLKPRQGLGLFEGDPSLLGVA